ncbi:hypothetical protein AWU65_20330 [Paenibacillus glucanolyticus]|uniref:Uncharacterized protein n=1 Tax=Paenibacillus glucanolyticus TaxID=59843 RepID=A0A163LGA0_9BACL|nr:hypothetical protein [Paenibacillus glucanolyticus]KZS48106.1 hypothetical protein AWU65_20330 [Paenibacillus glucanolyticus]
MRPLTLDEKALSKAAKQRANKQLQAQRRKIGVRIRDVKGEPVILEIEGRSITLNYEMLRRFIRSLKNRHWNMSLDISTGSSVLVISHHIDLWSKDRGYIELYDLPAYQKELLTELPVIEIERN